MIIYIAAGWVHRHAVDLLTSMLCAQGHVVSSFTSITPEPVEVEMDLWLNTTDCEKAFNENMKRAVNADLVICADLADADVWSIVGAANVSKVPCLGLRSSSREKMGIRHHMVERWCADCWQLSKKVKELAENLPSRKMELYAPSAN